jgi:prolyl-tRNA synthetase
VAEGTCDERGLNWPRELAPFDVQVLATGKGTEIEEAAAALAADLDAAGLKVLLDDRKASPGVKFTDAEIMGMPTSVVVGRGLADGLIEVRDRASGERVEVLLAEAVAHLLAVVHGR